MEISICIAAFNEEKDIGKSIESLLSQTVSTDIREIIVVSSSTDSTDDIVSELMKRDSRITLHRERERRGKAASIDFFLKNSSGEILILHNADLVSESNAIEELVKPFRDPKVGLVGGHPVPVNREDSFMGFMVNLVWRLHHRISLSHPKMGELIAFRRVFDAMPDDVVVDEAWAESVMRENGYRIVYVPTAVIHNKGPQTLGDLFRQRKRIAVGHYHLKRVSGYSPSTMVYRNVFPAVVSEIMETPGRGLHILAAVFLEACIRISAYLDFLLGKKPYKWEVSPTSKDVGDA